MSIVFGDRDREWNRLVYGEDYEETWNEPRPAKVKPSFAHKMPMELEQQGFTLRVEIDTDNPEAARSLLRHIESMAKGMGALFAPIGTKPCAGCPDAGNVD